MILKTILASIAILGLAQIRFGYDSTFDRTKPGETEVKEIPDSLALEASSGGDYFDGRNDDNTFMKLFRYIQRNEIKMTVPVEVDVDEGNMRFFVGKDSKDREHEDSKDVTVAARPARLVVSTGLRGGYSEKRFEKGKERLEAWLDGQTEYRSAGEPVAVYWNGPFTPGFLKQSEVYIPVEKVQD